MNKKLKLMVTIAAIAVGLTGVNSAMAATDNSIDNLSMASSSYKIAVVDVQQVVASSAQVATLKKDQEAKAKDLISFIEKARKDVAAVKDEKAKATLEQKYNKELNTRKEAMDKAYAAKLSEIDTSISKQITTIAKSKGYNMVIA